MKNSTTTPPKHLSADAKRWWRRIQAEYDIDDDAGKLLLQTALESFDRMRNCQAAIERDGELVRDRFDQLKPHPLLSAERDSRAQMLAALKALNLDLEPLRDRVGRPAGAGPHWNGD
ncbi:P27 family phage terminase small subunit [Thioalkalivibrio sp.]|uniref:P27 family phage terminase small subunit n=1 Tax=Thioalkalivibrio sp. TaxID=2093813 RepID=UPI0035640171